MLSHLSTAALFFATAFFSVPSRALAGGTCIAMGAAHGYELSYANPGPPDLSPAAQLMAVVFETPSWDELTSDCDRVNQSSFDFKCSNLGTRDPKTSFNLHVFERSPGNIEAEAERLDDGRAVETIAFDCHTNTSVGL